MRSPNADRNERGRFGGSFEDLAEVAMKAPTFDEMMIAAEILGLQEGEYGDPTSPASIEASACRRVGDWLEHEAKRREGERARRSRRRMSAHQ